MSRNYNMNIEVTGYNPDHAPAITLAMEESWEGDAVISGPRDSQCIWLNEDGSLCGGQSEDDFAREIATAIMQANQGPCQVHVCATYLDNLPYENYHFDKEDYESLVADATS